MGTKISNLSEIHALVETNTKRDEGVLGFAKQFKIGQLLHPFRHVKKQGFSIISVLIAMLLSRFGGLSIYAMQKTGQTNMDDNTIYRLMDNPIIDWRSIVRLFAHQFMRCVRIHGEDNGKEKCFILDDTDIPKTGKTIEGGSRIYNHVLNRYIFGFKLLVLCYWDGKSLVPYDFSLHRESKKKNYGLTAKEQKKQHQTEYPSDSATCVRYNELDMEKTVTGLSMIKRAIKHGIHAAYVLIDSWFVTDDMIKSIRKFCKGKMHVIGMCKMDSRKFTVNGKDYNSKAIIALNDSKKGNVHESRIYHSKYIVVKGIYKGTPVKLFYIKYKHAQNWTLLLTTDLSLSFAKAMELYQIRWSIEVFFKDCKQYLRLGKAQNICLSGQIADISLTFITYMILALKKRFASYETIGNLFREAKSELLEATIAEKILFVFAKILGQLLDMLAIDVNESMMKIIDANENSEKILLLLNAVIHVNSSVFKNENVS
jgi:hypothetical protein